MNDIQELTQAAKQFIHDRDWKQFHKPKDCAISLTLEAAEMVELSPRKPFLSKLEKSAKKYPVEKAKGNATKYTEL